MYVCKFRIQPAGEFMPRAPTKSSSKPAYMPPIYLSISYHARVDRQTNPRRVATYVHFASSIPPPGEGRSNCKYADYGGGGLFWPFGGAGFFVSGGVVDVIGGEGGFRRCVEMFGHMNTDVQVCVCACVYVVGLLPRETIRQACQPFSTAHD